MNIRIGMGYDVHKLVPGRALWLGGIKIDHTLGLLGHSDADVLIHAICDALLGAANMRDIGYQKKRWGGLEKRRSRTATNATQGNGGALI